MILAQISDLHVDLPGKKLAGRVDTAACLARAVAQIERLRPQPDVLLITGDLVNQARAEEYVHLRELLSPIRIPTFVIPGNHDDRDNLRAAFADHTYLPREGFLHYAIDDYPLRIIALDTVVPGEDGGALDEARLLWLAARLHESEGRPVIIVMHHPPFLCGIDFMDAMGLQQGRDDFTRLVARYPNVERILCGHIHRAIEARVGSAIAMTCPATCHQIALSLEADAPGAYTLEPPGFRLHLWDGRQMVTHTMAIGNFPGPYRF